ncbi:ras-related protein Rap1-like [Cryptotermes secundus]|uniref:ras-related protein Rap1-like n=1 Tax=Cryptotermes secundus TaxID=105785 RepID=UPI001454D6AB|nr:ras-related protein Rap1-like [Cryptotermes secundus]
MLIHALHCLHPSWEELQNRFTEYDNAKLKSVANTQWHSNHSNLSGVSPGERSPFEGSCCGSSYNNISSEGSVEEITKYRVVLLGDAGVGKTALVSQFMTSEYMNTYDASLDDEFGEKTVSVLLDGEESEMIFIDHPSVEMSVENSLSTYEPHACVVVYSIVDRNTFKVGEDILNYLWRENYIQEKSVILVGNKADLARSRVIPINVNNLIDMVETRPVLELLSSIPLAKQVNVDEIFKDIKRRGVIEEAGSPWSPSVVLARKKTGDSASAWTTGIRTMSQGRTLSYYPGLLTLWTRWLEPNGYPVWT